MTVATINKNDYFEKDYTFTADGSPSDPTDVTFSLTEPDATVTPYVYDGIITQVSKLSVGVYRVRVAMTGALGGYAYTMRGEWTTGTLGDEYFAGVISVVDAAQTSFHYTPQALDDVSRVRYHIQDVDEATMIFSDGEIEMVIDEEGTYKAAVISLLTAIIAKISHEPDMTADWLTVSWRRSADSWHKLLGEKRRSFGIGLQVKVTSSQPYRIDSLRSDGDDVDWSK